MNQDKVLVTGASGFLGQFLVGHLVEAGFKPKVLLRKIFDVPKDAEVFLLPPKDSVINWPLIVHDCSIVIHLLARVHVMKDKSNDPLKEFRNINVDITTNLAKEAARQGVKRFIFLSSIKVNGELTHNKPFTESDKPQPEDAYAISKWEAEKALKKISQDTGMEIVIIRSPLVYGPGVKANFLKMIKYIQRGIPLPLGAIQNKRSLVSVYNLIDFISTTISHPMAANEIFLISDDDDISTTDLLYLIGKFMGKPARLISLSPKILSAIFNIIGRKKFADRLFGSLEIDISKAKNLLAWFPPLTLKEGLKLTIISK